MSRRKSKIIGWFTIFTMFFACREGNVDRGKSLPESKFEVNYKESKVEFDTSLYTCYRAIIDTSISDEINFDILQKRFFSVARPTKSAYFFYFRFIQTNRNASLSEQVSINSFTMWKEDKEKSIKLIEYVNKLPIIVRSSILKSLVQAMCLDLNANGYNLQLFKRDFPFLSDSVSLNSAKGCFDNWVE